MSIYRKLGLFWVSLIVFSFATSAWGAPAISVTPGYEAYEESLIGFRLRSFNNTGGSELYLGVPDLGVSGNRVEEQMQWAATNDVSFSFDRDADSLNLTVVNANDTYSLDYPNVSTQLVNLGKTYTVDDLNVMQLTVVDRDQNGTVEFQNVMVDGQLLGDFSGSGWLDWMVTDYDFSQGFVMTGTLALTGSFGNSQELSKVNVHLGYKIIPDTTPPTTTIDKATVVADVIAPELGTAVFEFSGADDTTTPENLSFECRLNEADWVPCVSPASYDNLAAGDYTFAVRATDEADNTDATPAEYQWQVKVTYLVFLPSIHKD